MPGCGCREMNAEKKKPHITHLLSHTLINVTAPFDLVTFSFNGRAASKKRPDTPYTATKCVIGVRLNIAVIITDPIVDEVKGKK